MAFAISAIASVVLVNVTLGTVQMRAQPALRFEQAVRAALPNLPSGTAIASAPGLPPTINYMITVGDLRTPRDERGFAPLTRKYPDKGIDYVVEPIGSSTTCSRETMAGVMVVDYSCFHAHATKG